jgi:uncharacterized protein
MRGQPRGTVLAFLVAGCILLVALACAGEAATAPTFPPLTDRVVDDAGVLSPATRARLTEELAAAEQKTGDQVVVVTVKSLQGYAIEDYGYQLGRQWGIGRKEKNNGALLLVAPAEHQVRIEVGYGLEGDLTDAASKLIIERLILPYFRQGDFDSGVSAGVGAILQTIGAVPEGTAVQPPPPQMTRERGDQGFPSPFLILILLFVLFRGFRFFWPALFLGGFGPRGPWMGGGVGGGFGGGSFGSGGFSGGGGSFGGGGASGQW